MKKETFARAILALCMFALLLAVIFAEHWYSKSKKEKEERAAGWSVNATQYDTTPLPTWDEAPESSVRMIYGWYNKDGEIITADGNLWGMNTEEINPEETLLIWFDTKNTPEVQDDEIVKIWKGVYD